MTKFAHAEQKILVLVVNCNCPPKNGWSEDSGLLTDKSTLPVTQIRLGDLDNPHEKGNFRTLQDTLGKLKCYGQGQPIIMR